MSEVKIVGAPTESIFDLFETDEDLLKAGVWMTFGKYGKMKIAYAGEGNQRYMKLMETKFRQHRREIQLNALPEKEARALFIDVISESVVLDWDFIDKAKQPIPFSVAKVKELFTRLPTLFDEVRQKSADWQNFRASELAIDEGN